MIGNLNNPSNPFAPSELILNDDGSIYHIKLKPEHIADKVIVVGDQNRVERISRHFDSVEHKITNREFVTHVGKYKGTPITALSTGIGADNIDIVINEIDALVNIDLNTRLVKENKRSLEIVRLGTSGSLQEDIPVDSFIASTYGLGFDGLAGFYDHAYELDEKELATEFFNHINWKVETTIPYFAKGNNELIKKIGVEMNQGITITGNGFYGPQGRILRLKAFDETLNERLRSFNYNGNRVTNFEMETSALYSLSSMLGHKACTVCAIIANRMQKAYSRDYKKTVDELIEITLDNLIK